MAKSGSGRQLLTGTNQRSEMELEEFIDSFGDFTEIPELEQVKLLCWYLTTYRNLETLTWSDVLACFNDTACPVPKMSYHNLFNLSQLKPPFLLCNGMDRFQMCRPARKDFDEKYGKRESTRAVEKSLLTLRNDLPPGTESVYLDEAITCFRSGAFRATIVMAWNLAFDHLLQLILKSKLVEFNNQLPKTFPKADILEIKCLDDFERLKESQVIQVAKSANIVSLSVHTIMAEKLKRRNAAAHPTDVIISQPSAEEFVQDLITNVVQKL